VALKSLDDLPAHVKQSGGVVTLSAERLRDLYGADRLGRHVRAGISQELAGLGLAHYPEELPDRQHEPVRVYQQGSQVAEIIASVLNVHDPKADLRLRKAAKNDGEKVLQKIRELLDEEE